MPSPIVCHPLLSPPMHSCRFPCELALSVYGFIDVGGGRMHLYRLDSMGVGGTIESFVYQPPPLKRKARSALRSHSTKGLSSFKPIFHPRIRHGRIVHASHASFPLSVVVQARDGACVAARTHARASFHVCRLVGSCAWDGIPPSKTLPTCVPSLPFPSRSLPFGSIPRDLSSRSRVGDAMGRCFVDVDVVIGIVSHRRGKQSALRCTTREAVPKLRFERHGGVEEGGGVDAGALQQHTRGARRAGAPRG